MLRSISVAMEKERFSFCLPGNACGDLLRAMSAEKTTKPFSKGQIMPRPFNQRSDYNEEIVYMQRLVRLFRADKMLPEKARDKIIGNLRETLELLATEEKKETLPIEDRLLVTRKKVGSGA